MNAIEHAARIITAIRDLADDYKSMGPYDHDFDVPFTTLQTSMIRGGIALNTVPDLCEFEFEYRNLPGVDPEPILQEIREFIDLKVLPAMRREHPDALVELEKLASAPGLNPEEQAAITKLVRELTRDDTVRVLSTAPKQVCSSKPVSLRLFVAPAISSRPTAPMNTWNWPRWNSASSSCAP